MSDVKSGGPYRLELTPAELKITWSALRSMLNDFGHDEPDVHRLVQSVLRKLPPEQEIRAIDLELKGRARGPVAGVMR